LEPRCFFYNQSDFWRKGHERCFKAGGQACLALPESKECSSVSQSDGAPMIVAYSGLLKLVSTAGERIIPAAQLFTGKGETPFSLAAEEVLTEIRLPRPAGRTGAAYEKLAFRSSLDFPLVSAAAVVGVGSDTFERARLVLGGVGPAPLTVPVADQVLRGQEPSPDLIDEVCSSAAESAAGRITGNTWSSADYRRQMVRVVARRALLRAIDRAWADQPGDGSRPA
jgi:CO/xanthine dehydrogenase FAD-binding subunit